MMVAVVLAVPDLEAKESSIVEDDGEDLLYRVLVFDPMLVVLYNPMPDEGSRSSRSRPASRCLRSRRRSLRPDRRRRTASPGSTCPTWSLPGLGCYSHVHESNMLRVVYSTISLSLSLPMWPM